MKTYIKESGNNEDITINRYTKSVEFGKSTYIASVALFVSNKKDYDFFDDSYCFFKEKFKDKRIVDLYREKDFESIYKYIFPIIKQGHMVIGLTNKHIILSRVIFDIFMGEKTFLARPGISIEIISNIAKMKDSLMYPFLATCFSPILSNMKNLSKILLDCPYFYMSDSYNILKGQIKKMYWETIYDQFLEKITAYEFKDLYMLEQYVTISSTLPVIKKADLLSQKSMLILIHDSEYMYEQKLLDNRMEKQTLVTYFQLDQEEVLQLADELSEFIQVLLEDVLLIYHHKEDYNQDSVQMMVDLLWTNEQTNFEFQLLIDEWCYLMGIMDIYDRKIPKIYKRKVIIDEQIRYHYFRVNEFFKLRPQDRRVLEIFKNRLKFQ